MSGKNLEVTVASHDALDVRTFSVQQQMSALFTVSIVAECTNPSIDFDAVVGHEASFTLQTPSGPRSWHGICNSFEQVQAEESGLSTYELTIVPTMWLLSQRRNYRIFQQLSEIEIVQKLLSEWSIEPEMKLDAAAYKKRKYRVQYAESDYDFTCRILEDVGVSFYFEQSGETTKLVLTDAPQENEPRGTPLPFMDNPNARMDREHVTNVQIHQRVRPGKYTVRDHDYRLPATYELKAEATGGQDVEQKLERFHYNPGAFLFRSEKGEDTPQADDKGKTRSDEGEGSKQAQRRLAAKRSGAKRVTFEGNAFDVAPGVVFGIVNHPHKDLGPGKNQLVLEVSIHGTDDGEWSLSAEAVSADQPYHPPAETPKPKVQGVESATVVGPSGEEIHTDEFGRVRVQFHWDREGRYDDNSSCWIPVSQPWAGTGYGGTNLPRVGQEVLVDFLGGDPDRPVITGRVFTNLQKTPYKLPDNKTQSGWRSNSTGGSGGYNEIMFEDAGGRELVRMQAERDRETLVKNDSRSTILGNRTTFVGGANAERVASSESLTVSKQRSVTVMDSLSHTVKSGITTTCQEGNTVFETKQRFSSHAEEQVFDADAKLLVSVGGASTIYVTRDYIILNAPKVLINPGAEALAAAMNDQPLPPSDSEREAQEKAARDAARRAEAARNTEAMAQAMTLMPMP